MAETRECRLLLDDASLAITWPTALGDAIAPWLPRGRLPAPAGEAAAARIDVDLATPTDSEPTEDGEPLLRLGDVVARTDAGGIRLTEPGGVRGLVRPDLLHAAITAPTADAPAWPLGSALTVAAALLISRLGGALIHAAAVVAPGGDGWLLVGDARAGKTSTTATLIAAGWEVLTDDHVVLRRRDGALVLEGWPRAFHLDSGWAVRQPTGERLAVEPGRLAGARLRRTARLAGVLLPAVEAGERTRLVPAEPGSALAALIRQSPWLLADRASAPGVLAMLKAAAVLPSYRLHLGRDSFAQPERLIESLDPLHAA